MALINGIIKDDTNATNRFIPISKKLVAARNASEVRELTFRMLMNFFECSTGQETIGAFHIGRRVNLRFLEGGKEVAHEESCHYERKLVLLVVYVCEDW